MTAGIPTHVKKIARVAQSERESYVEAKATTDFEACQSDVCSEFDSESRDAAMGVLDDTLDDDCLGRLVGN